MKSLPVLKGPHTKDAMIAAECTVFLSPMNAFRLFHSKILPATIQEKTNIPEENPQERSTTNREDDQSQRSAHFDGSVGQYRFKYRVKSQQVILSSVSRSLLPGIIKLYNFYHSFNRILTFNDGISNWESYSESIRALLL